MIYVTAKRAQSFHQMTLEELLFGAAPEPRSTLGDFSYYTSDTRTIEVESISPEIRSRVDPTNLLRILNEFNASTQHLREQKRSSLYTTFHIPKKSGGLRRIDAPCEELMDALRTLKTIFERDFGALYHTSAFAYVNKRSTIDALRRHQSNESHWFAKFDLHDFFGSTTPEFLLNQLSMVFPFSELASVDGGMEALETALDLAFLNGGLPQGTPISPLLTNVMMIPVDYKLTKALRDFDKTRLVYTRYADDFIISCKYTFDYHKVEKLIVDTLNEFGAKFYLNRAKTRYGSNTGSGANWNLGLMLNKDNKITIGHKKKRMLMTMIHNYVTDKRKGSSWSYEDVCTLQGYINYFVMVEPEAIRNIIFHLNQKKQCDVMMMIKNDLRS